MTELERKIFDTLEFSNFDWHSWLWWSTKDNYFKNFTPEEIDKTAHNMAEKGLIESNHLKDEGFRRKPRTRKEKILKKLHLLG